MQPAKWPEVLPPMTPEQTRTSDALMKLWHEQLPPRAKATTKAAFGLAPPGSEQYP